MLQALHTEELTALLQHALQDERGFGGQKVRISEDMIGALATFANGDARTALSTLEMVVLNGDVLPDGSIEVSPETLEQCTARKSLLYDKIGEEHSNIISALHQSLRFSDPDAASVGISRTSRKAGSAK